MIISPFSSVYFPGAQKQYGRDCGFVQFFANGDHLNIQVLRTEDEDAVPSRTVSLDNTSMPAGYAYPDSYEIGGGMYVDVYSLVMSVNGFFKIAIGDAESEPFEVTNDTDRIAMSVLMQYSPSENSARQDVVATIGTTRQYFAVRFPGGFKPDGFNFSVDNEQFTSQTSDIVELYSRESMQETLTVGWGRGVPIWFGQMLNRILTCRYVYIDGLRYARYESSVPEKQQVLDGVNGFIFTQKVQRINYIEPTKS